MQPSTYTHYRGCPVPGETRPTADGFEDVWWSGRCSVLGCVHATGTSRWLSVIQRSIAVHLDRGHPHVAAGIAVHRREIGLSPVCYAARCTGTACEWEEVFHDEAARDRVAADHIVTHDNDLAVQ